MNDTVADLGKHNGANPRLEDAHHRIQTRHVGPRTVLPSSFRVTDAANALVAAYCHAVTEIRDVRATASTNRPEISEVMVHSIGSAVAFSSERHLRFAKIGGLWDEFSGHYQTADGAIQFHTNFAHHRNALLSATGCGPGASRTDVEKVVSAAGRFELEQRVLDAGGIAAALRTEDEWANHPHAEHVKDREPLIVSGLGCGGPAPLSTADAAYPLAGIRVLDMTRVIAGPVCTRALASYGADVIRIGDESLPIVDTIIADTTLGKRFTHCNIGSTAGRDAVLELAERADVVVTGFRPGALQRHGLGDEDFLAANPNLVLAELSAFGADGPWGGRPGFDSITQTATGIVAAETQAFGSETPRPLPCQLLDHGTGFLLALGVVSALLNRHDGAGAQKVSASLLTTRNWLHGLGRADPYLGRIPDAQQVMAFVETRDSPYGLVTHAKPPGRITGTPARWNSGPVLPGSDAPHW